jgi:hypothetical protein
MASAISSSNPADNRRRRRLRDRPLADPTNREIFNRALLSIGRIR